MIANVQEVVRQDEAAFHHSMKRRCLVHDYKWRSRLYITCLHARRFCAIHSLVDGAKGAKTIQLIHENITSVDIGETLEELVINSAVIDAAISKAEAKVFEKAYNYVEMYF